MIEYDKRRLHAACVTAFLFVLFFAAVSPQIRQFEKTDIFVYEIFYALFLGLTCLTALFSGRSLPEKKKRAYAVLLFAIMPSASFAMFEVVSGNIRTVLANGTGIILMNLFLWYLLYFAAFAVTNRVRTAILLMNALSYLLAVANAFVVSFRGQPIMPMDLNSLRTAATVASEFDYTLTPEMILMGLMMLLCSLCAWNVNCRLTARNVRLAFVVISAVCFFGVYDSNAAKAAVRKAGASGLDFFRFNETYKVNGYLLSTLQSIWSLTIEKPAGYSAAKVKELADSVEQAPAEETQLPENIIVIMNESFADLSVLGDVSVSEEVLPFTNSLTENTVKGNLYVSIHGGGTANSEFEFLTGNSIAFLPAGAVAYQMYIDEGDSSIVSVLNENGYKTVAFHPYNKTNYNRPKVYGAYGFDSYIGKGDRKFKKLRGYTSDLSDYKTLIDLYEEKEAGEKLFVFNVTVQNHGGYNDEGYESAVFLTDYPGQFPEAEQYLTLMQESDRAFQMLIDYFSKVEERTAVLLFGDHQPFLGMDFYEAVIGEAETEIQNIEEFQKKLVTPYVLWTNYNIDAVQEEHISTNFLGSYFLKSLGFQLPKYNQFLLDLQQNVFPALNISGYLDKQGNMHYIWDENEYQELLNQYWMFEYNNLFDNRKRLKGFFE